MQVVHSHFLKRLHNEASGDEKVCDQEHNPVRWIAGSDLVPNLLAEVLSLNNTHANGQNPYSTDGAADEGQHAVVFVTHASSLALKHLACQLQVSLGKPLGIHHFDVVD